MEQDTNKYHTIKYYLYNIISNVIFAKESFEKLNINKLIDDLLRNLLKNSSTQSSVELDNIKKIFKLCGKFITNNMTTYDDISNELLIEMKNDLLISLNYETFINKIILGFNKYISNKKTVLEEGDDWSKINDICKNIKKLGIFLDESFVKSSDEKIYTLCYPKWGNHLIEQIKYSSESNDNIAIIINYLKMMEPYIGSNEFCNKIVIKYNKYILDVLESSNPLDANLNNMNLYNKLVSINNLTNKLLEILSKYEDSTKTIDLLNSIYTNKIMEYYNIGFKISIEKECEKNMNEGIESQNIKMDELINSYLILLKLSNADYSLLSYLQKLQSRYHNLMSDCKLIKCKEMIKIDNHIMKNINEYLENNHQLKEHVSKSIDKILNVLSDIDNSLTATKEMHLINIKYKNKDGQIVSNEMYSQKNILYTLVSDGTNWTEHKDDITNNYNINYNSALKFAVNTFNEYYLQKCSQRKIKYFNDSSTVILNYNNYKLKLTLAQSSILMLFDKSNLYKTFDEICLALIPSNDTNESIKQQVKRLCKSLVYSQILLQVTSDKYQINIDLKFPEQYNNGNMIINMIKFYYKALKDTDDIVVQEVKQIVHEIDYDRSNTLKCYIIRLVKLNKTKYYTINELYDNLKLELKIFDYDLTEITNIVGQLTKNYYLDKEGQKYIYSDE